ncbi:Glycoside hydrolase, 38 vacuolar alpha mannosidase [Physocladia obscura]|uniref:Glycoside hydrolase, 38 vacuolar alpha mannosidase n=1 Tax=Physocladia obscura TaxID=109957 RepID=A0AAD5XBX3_9FUNG|nr:Glycoside hydrolase, 38 vacuolar alpha mannosidase [Physocladia obscura]
MVYDDAIRFYQDVESSGNKLKKAALSAFMSSLSNKKESVQAVTVINTTSWPLDAEIVEVNVSELNVGVPLYGGATWQQMSKAGKALVYVDNVKPAAVQSYALGNKPDGFIPVTGRHESIAPDQLGNVFKIFEDIPISWDAWDVEVYHLEKGWNAGVGIATLEESGPLRTVITVKHQITPNSTIEQKIIITAADAKKVEFPLNVNCDYATYETQFGYIQRPTHYNTSWDLARFEVCGHRYADLSEFGFGVALLNDCKYGYSTHGNVMRLSLLRAPKGPDDTTDMEVHNFKYALYPHKGSFLESDVVKKAYQYNVKPIAHPALINPVNLAAAQFFSVSETNFVLDTLKLAEEPRKTSVGVFDIVLRFYEAYGGRGKATVISIFKVLEAKQSNLLEDFEEDGGKVKVTDDKIDSFDVHFEPFKIVTVRLLVSAK